MPGTSVHDLQNDANGIQDQGQERLNDVSVTVHSTAACDPQRSTDHSDTVFARYEHLTSDNASVGFLPASKDLFLPNTRFKPEKTKC